MPKKKVFKISSFTDESGQDTHGSIFVVCTLIIDNRYIDIVTNDLLKIELKSNKKEKWFRSSNKKRGDYVDRLLKIKSIPYISFYYSIYKNRDSYTELIASNVAKSIINHTKSKGYKVKINLDRDTRSTLHKIRSEIKKYRIKYQKIRGVSEDKDPNIRLADTICGLIRDLNNTNIPKSYKTLFKKLKAI